MKERKFVTKLFGFIIYPSEFRLFDLTLFHYLSNREYIPIVEIQICELRISIYLCKKFFKKIVGA